MKQLELAVVLHREDVAVATNKEFWRTGIELIANAPILTSRVTADMGHQNVGSLAGPPQLLREHTTQVTSVAVTDYGT